ncbi:ras association domain-containing protein 10 [Drosophila ficusphila]|uniref:ras association domain-containing protein 10 n=1 Tax=Drosophila ficusphila TaxID=30025 RepID=UPI0007E81ECB|nr:ras association domain-containing protein 10 [Drosophila ficusphila]XP_017057806.1 ras association domain-containing protein 10 [Drosophila ficusphila]XP_017057807.1 ras association domain-containing protein 10 [Drosophila ficusphila]
MTTEPAASGFEPSCSAAPGDDDKDSLSSLSDNLSIWIDGEEHWISGVDATTTCTDLICALIGFQTAQQMVLPEQRALPERLEPGPSKHRARTPQEFVIVQKQRHYEEYLDGSARLLDIIASRHAFPEVECQLQLRHLATSARKHTQNTDKDSGMGSPVDSSRSMRFRRRGRHKATSCTNNMHNPSTKQPKRSRKMPQRNSHIPNENLLTIILAQDETILLQMSMLHEKDRQILKIEEEKHRVRERELGKNYLLETYLKDLDELQDNSHATKSFQNVMVRLHQDSNEGTCSDKDCRYSDDGDTVKDEIRLFWLEKIHEVNKQLQREEEHLLSLHAKVRRHQVKRAYQTKSEVLLQINRLDAELAAQVADIHRVERKLFTANEQLKAKLGVLECLGREFETKVSGGDSKADTKVESASAAPLLEDLPGKRAPVLEKGSIKCHTSPVDSQKKLRDRNLKEWQVLDKGFSKQMFIASRSADTVTPTCVLKRDFGSTNAYVHGSETDIQHLGTLV